MDIGSRLRKLRLKFQMTQDDVAEICGVSKSLVSQWESNALLPATQRILALRQKLDFSIDWLLVGGLEDHTSARDSIRALIGVAQELPDYAVINLTREGRSYGELIERAAPPKHGKHT